LENILATLEKTLQGGKFMEPRERFNGFDLTEIEKHKQAYAEEIRRKYGTTSAYRESERKTASYTPPQWRAITREAQAIQRRIADRMENGAKDPEVQKAVADWRRHITNWFYKCTPEIFKGLGELYVSDSRFSENLDQIKPGLARFLSSAIKEYCRKLPKK
jgi:hypothetical protein